MEPRGQGGRFRRGGGCLLLTAAARWLKSALPGREGWRVSISFLLLLVMAIVAAAIWCPLSFTHALYGGDRQRETGGWGKHSFPRKQPGEPRDEHLGGLLAGGFDGDNSCQSRYEAGMLRKPSPYKPSSYLVQRLRQYEALHRRCGPHTSSYNATVALLKSGGGATAAEADCKYVLWTPAGGLGNRILSLASTFLYALLTGRVVLVDRGRDFSGLMCEPFPGTSWVLPLDFPISNMRSFGLGDALSYGSLLRSKKIRNDVVARPIPGRPPPLSFVYLHLVSDYSLQDTFFFCEEDQLALREVPWLLVRSDGYFAPGLFLNALFEPELRFMFPDKEAVFHHLCRYLFHPSDKVWEMVAGYYDSYLAAAEERVGIQIRVFDQRKAPFEVILEQVINCTMREKLLPETDANGEIAAGQRKTRSVLVTSLYSGYLEGMQKMYAKNLELVSFHQPSREGRQVKDDEGHDMKAWAEMNLLGFADVLVTTAQSTFGYVGQALSGVKPWILVRTEKAIVPEPACVRETSLEPCFHSAPQFVCSEKKKGDWSKLVPYLARCTDVPWGIKLLDPKAAVTQVPRMRCAPAWCVILPGPSACPSARFATYFGVQSRHGNNPLLQVPSKP